MPAVIIKGATVAKAIQAEIKPKIDAVRSRKGNLKIAVLRVGEDPASVWYARNIAVLGEKLGITVEVIALKPGTEDELESFIRVLNDQDDVHGIMIQLPLPKHYRKDRILNSIAPVKDIDGVTAVNRGYILGGQEDLALVPATPLACIELINRSGISLKGKRITIVGRGDTVGRPLAALLINRDATVTVCHTKTADLAGECRKAEIIIAAAGKAHLITKDMICSHSVVIDVGFNEIAGGQIAGDVDFENVKELAAVLTPVPGGVGSLTTTIILANALNAYRIQNR